VAERGGRVNDGGGVALAPLRETLALAVEVPQQDGHAHGHRAHDEAAAEPGLGGIECSREVALQDQDRSATLPQRLELGRVGDEDEAVGTRFRGWATVRRDGCEVAPQKGEDVGMPALDDLRVEHGIPLREGAVRATLRRGAQAAAVAPDAPMAWVTGSASVTRAVTNPLKSSHAWLT